MKAKKCTYQCVCGVYGALEKIAWGCRSSEAQHDHPPGSNVDSSIEMAQKWALLILAYVN